MYFICEIQNGAYLMTTKQTRNEAESEYHRIMSAAAVSNVETHSCIVFTEEGFTVLDGCYKHPAEPEE